LRERHRVLETILRKFPRIDQCTAHTICDEVDWNELYAFEAAEEIIKQCQSEDLKKRGEQLPIGCLELCQEFPNIDKRLVSLAFIRGEYDLEYARDYLVSEPLLASLKQELFGTRRSDERSERALAILSGPSPVTVSPRPPSIAVAPKLNDEKKTKTVDLHGYTVDEACDVARETMANLASGFKKVNFITGRGVHSRNGEAKIRPMILHLMNFLGYERRLMPANPGIIEVLPEGQQFSELLPPEVGHVTACTNPPNPARITSPQDALRSKVLG
jgi:hypothetical protein